MTVSEEQALNTFLDRCQGQWNSDRRYFYPNTANREPEQFVVELDIKKSADGQFSIEWHNHLGDHHLEFQVRGLELLRSRGYATAKPTTSKVVAVTESSMTTETCYPSALGSKFVESIVFLSDSLRVRQTVSYKDGTIYLIGQYLETRKSSHE